MAKVIHKEYSFYNKWYLEAIHLFFWLYDRFIYLITKNKTSVTCEYDKDFIYKAIDQDDWRKIYGSKSGVNTETNNEEIVVNRCIFKNGKAYVEQGRYIRRKKLGFHLENIVRKEIPEKGSVNITTDIKVKHLLPAFSYAGGDKMNTSNYKYKIKMNFGYLFRDFIPFLIILLLLVGEIRCIYKAVTCDWSNRTSYKAEAIYTVSALTGLGVIVGYFDIEDK